MGALEGIAAMHLIATLILLMILIPAALAGIASALVDGVANIECLSAALPHASAMLAEVAPMAPAAALLLAGVATLAVAGWLIVRVVNG
jgi:hypothetical protein